MDVLCWKDMFVYLYVWKCVSIDLSGSAYTVHKYPNNEESALKY